MKPKNTNFQKANLCHYKRLTKQMLEDVILEMREIAEKKKYLNN